MSVVWEIVIVIAIAGHPEFKSPSHSSYPTREVCQNHIIKAVQEFMAEAQSKGMVDYSFKAECRQAGEPV